MTHRILVGDCRATLLELHNQSVQCVVTSPPYWGLRDYGTAEWVGGDPSCSHAQGRNGSGRADGIVDERGQRNRDGVGALTRRECACGAVRVDHQIGLEPTPDGYIAHLVEVFREVWRVLRDDGTLWLNLGDSYAAQRAGWSHTPHTGIVPDTARGVDAYGEFHKNSGSRNARKIGLKHKDLVGIPWAVAFALREDGWYLRQDIIWSKGNCMPESVVDRCTRSHEYLFMLTKKPWYFYDSDAIREQASNRVPGNRNPQKGADMVGFEIRGGLLDAQHKAWPERNKRSVWNVNPRPYEGAHFATFPPALVEPCILSGTSAAGCCPTCGTPWKRVAEKGRVPDRPNRVQGRKGDTINQAHIGGDRRAGNRYNTTVRTQGWKPGCKCPGQDPVPCTVLDPFGGSGTVGMVANWHGRDSILCELNPEYVKLIEERVKMDKTETGGWKPAVSDEASLDLLGEL